MNPQPLKDRLTEIQSHLDNFRQKLIDSESSYQKSLSLLNIPELRSSLMEQHCIHTNRQKLAIARLEKLYSELQSKLATGSIYRFN